MEHSNPRCHRVFGSKQLAIIDKPWLLHCFERHQLAWSDFDLVLLLHHHRLLGLEASLWRTPATAAVVFGQIWLGYQHFCTHFCDSDPVLLRVAADVPGHTAEYVSLDRRIWAPLDIR